MTIDAVTPDWLKVAGVGVVIARVVILDTLDQLAMALTVVAKVVSIAV